jgi:hypothetical protein
VLSKVLFLGKFNYYFEVKKSELQAFPDCFIRLSVSHENANPYGKAIPEMAGRKNVTLKKYRLELRSLG